MNRSAELPLGSLQHIGFEPSGSPALRSRLMVQMRVQCWKWKLPWTVAWSADSFVRAIPAQSTRGQGCPRSFSSPVPGNKSWALAAHG